MLQGDHAHAGLLVAVAHEHGAGLHSRPARQPARGRERRRRRPAPPPPRPATTRRQGPAVSFDHQWGSGQTSVLDAASATSRAKAAAATTAPSTAAATAHAAHRSRHLQVPPQLPRSHDLDLHAHIVDRQAGGTLQAVTRHLRQVALHLVGREQRACRHPHPRAQARTARRSPPAARAARPGDGQARRATRPWAAARSIATLPSSPSSSRRRRRSRLVSVSMRPTMRPNTSASSTARSPCRVGRCRWE